MMEHLSFCTIADAEKLAQRLALDVAGLLQSAVATRGQAILVVSGGSTPKPFFRYLSEIDLDWKKIVVTLADERCVEPDDAQSNARFVREHLLRDFASAAEFVSLFEGGDASAAAAEKAAIKLSPLPVYDVVILGMGNDGHTASIFPESVNRADALDPKQTSVAMLVDPVTVTPLRITQTAPRLLNTSHLMLHINGAEKARLLKTIIEKPDPGKWPVSHFIKQQQVPLSIYSDVELAS